jgi:hypothetical protein
MLFGNEAFFADTSLGFVALGRFGQDLIDLPLLLLTEIGLS